MKHKQKTKQNETKTKHPTLSLRRRRGRVASEDNSNHPPFCFRRQLPSKQKEMSCYRFRQRDCKCTWSNIHRLGTPFLIALETVAENIRIPCSHAKKIRIRNLRFRKIHFRERFRKAPFGGPSVFKKLRIRADTCDRFYVSGVEKLRFRKDPGRWVCTCGLVLTDQSETFRLVRYLQTQLMDLINSHEHDQGADWPLFWCRTRTTTWRGENLIVHGRFVYACAHLMQRVTLLFTWPFVLDLHKPSLASWSSLLAVLSWALSCKHRSRKEVHVHSVPERRHLRIVSVHSSPTLGDAKPGASSETRLQLNDFDYHWVWPR